MATGSHGSSLGVGTLGQQLRQLTVARGYDVVGANQDQTIEITRVEYPRWWKAYEVRSFLCGLSVYSRCYDYLSILSKQFFGIMTPPQW